MLEAGKRPAAVLVVDDEKDIRDGCERILTRMDLMVAKADHGLAGLEELERGRYDLVLLDLKMPGLDGLEVLKRIGLDHPEILVVIITGFATIETAIEAMKLGAYDFISKPFRPDQLRLTVDRALEKLRLQAQAQRLEEEKKRTLLDLSTQKSRTRAIIEALPYGVAVTNTVGQVALMNPAFNLLLGLDRDIPAGRPLSEYVNDRELCRLVEEVSQGGGTRPGAEQEPAAVEFSPGRDNYLLAQCTRVLNEEGEGLGAVLVVTDITQYKMLDRLKNEFLAKVSHELRSPLSTIHLQLGLLLNDGIAAQSSKGQNLLSRAHERTMGLITMIRDLLDMSRIEAGAGEEREVDLNGLLEAVVESVRPQADKKGQGLSLELPEKPLPPLTCDPTSLESVFTNLAANAVNYTPEGGRITVRAGLGEGRLKVEVADTGLGIEPEHLETIFEKFYRVKNEKTRYITGTGLGLAIVKATVENLGGRVEVASRPGEGSTFTVLIPLPEW